MSHQTPRAVTEDAIIPEFSTQEQEVVRYLLRNQSASLRLNPVEIKVIARAMETVWAQRDNALTIIQEQNQEIKRLTSILWRFRELKEDVGAAYRKYCRKSDTIKSDDMTPAPTTTPKRGSEHGKET